MKSIFLHLLAFILGVTAAPAQPGIQWEKVYGGSLSDYRCNSLDSTLDGGYIIAGAFAYAYNPQSPGSTSDSTDSLCP